MIVNVPDQGLVLSALRGLQNGGSSPSVLGEIMPFRSQTLTTHAEAIAPFLD